MGEIIIQKFFFIYSYNAILFNLAFLSLITAQAVAADQDANSFASYCYNLRLRSMANKRE